MKALFGQGSPSTLMPHLIERKILGLYQHPQSNVIPTPQGEESRPNVQLGMLFLVQSPLAFDSSPRRGEEDLI